MPFEFHMLLVELLRCIQKPHYNANIYSVDLCIRLAQIHRYTIVYCSKTIPLDLLQLSTDQQFVS